MDEAIRDIRLTGTVLAKLAAALLLLSLPCAPKKHEEDRTVMLNLRQKIAAVAIGCFVATGAFAQKQGERPPKPPNTVIVAPKGEKPPPSNNNQGGKKNNDKKGKN